MTLPIAVPSVALPTTQVRYVLGWGYSDAMGQGTLYSPSLRKVPCYPRLIGEHLGQAGKWEGLGDIARDQAVSSATQTGAYGVLTIKQGWLQTCAAALVSAGKNPIGSIIAESNTDMTDWDPGDTNVTLFDAWLAEQLAVLPAGITPHFVTLFGQKDALSAVNAAAYQARFGVWLDHVRALLPTCRAYVVQCNDAAAGGADLIVVQQAQLAVVAARSSWAQIVSWQACAWSSPHYTSLGYQQGGAIVAPAILANDP